MKSTGLWLTLIVLVALCAWIVIGAFSQKELPGKPAIKADYVWRTIELPGGKRVFIPKRPERIVPTNVGAADILSALIEPGRFAAVPNQVLEFAAAAEYWKQHKDIPNFEKYQAEPILATRPDLLVSSAFQDANTTSAIVKQNIPVLNFDAFETFDGIRAAILALGQAVGEETKAEKLAADFDARLNKVEARFTGKKRPRVLVYSNFGAGYTVGAGGSQEEIVTRAGGINAAAEIGLRGPAPITFEQILKLDPDVIVVCGENGWESPQVKLISNEPVLAKLRAINARKIAVVPTRLFDALSQHVVDAVEILSHQLYPDVPEKDSAPK